MKKGSNNVSEESVKLNLKYNKNHPELIYARAYNEDFSNVNSLGNLMPRHNLP